MSVTSRNLNNRFQKEGAKMLKEFYESFSHREGK